MKNKFEMVECEDCHQIVHYTERRIFQFKNLCMNCLKNYVGMCFDCNKPFTADNLFYRYGNYYCPKCYEKTHPKYGKKLKDILD